MAGVPIKFRCYACNQLLGVSRSKIGAVVSCPRCSADLVVPDPEESGAAQDSDEPGLSPSSPSPFVPPDPGRATGAMDTGVALDLLNIRPEDIRVEPGVRRDPATYQPPPATLPPDEEYEDLEPGRPEPPMPMPAHAAEREAIEPTILAPAPPPPAVEADETPIIAPIQLDAPPPPRASRRAAAAPSVRSRDLILPRSVVASWSLFVLLALLCAFFAGLFAGHYVWRYH